MKKNHSLNLKINLKKLPQNSCKIVVSQRLVLMLLTPLAPQLGDFFLLDKTEDAVLLVLPFDQRGVRLGIHQKANEKFPGLRMTNWEEKTTVKIKLLRTHNSQNTKTIFCKVYIKAVKTLMILPDVILLLTI